ncbi:MAG: AI-2E family transporter [Bacteroidota bacterium]
MANLDSGRMRQTFFLIIITALGLLIFWEVYPFLTALLGAVTFYVLFRGLMFHLSLRKRWNKTLSALLIMALSFVIILLPTGVLLKLLYDKLMVLLSEPDVWLAKVKAVVTQLNARLGTDLLSDKNVEQLPAMLGNVVPNILMATFDTLLIVALMYFILYFMLTGGRNMERWLYEYVPLKDENVIKIGNEIYSMVLSNAIGIPLLAIIQAVFAFFAYLFLGVPDPLLWGAVTAFASMLPVIGSTIVWFPLSLYLYFNGQEWQGITLWIFGAVVIINIDNVFRLVLQKRMADVHPLITMFGVIIGVSLFGFIGLIFGPLLVSMFILLLRIYNDEFVQKQRTIED